MVIHITNGDCAVDALRRGQISGDFLVWLELLHEGPVPPTLGLADLTALRAQFFVEQGFGTSEAVSARLQQRNNGLLHSSHYEETVLWFEHDLYDQLQLIQLLDWFADHKSPHQHISLIDADDYLGPMEPADIAALYPQRKPVTTEQYALAQRAWAAFRSPDPCALTQLIASETFVLAHLHEALLRWLEEYPSASNGLSRTEQQILAAVAGGRRRPAEIFAASQQQESAKFMGDTTFWNYLGELCAGSTPLLARNDGRPFLIHPKNTEDIAAFHAQQLVMTSTGAPVCEGRADRLASHSINRWRGGVHLRPGNIWRWDADQQQFIGPA